MIDDVFAFQDLGISDTLSLCLFTHIDMMHWGMYNQDDVISSEMDFDLTNG